MANILTPAVEKYLSEVIPARDEVLAGMEQYAREHSVPIIGPECGRLLYLLTQISGARRNFAVPRPDELVRHGRCGRGRSVRSRNGQWLREPEMQAGFRRRDDVFFASECRACGAGA